VTQASAAQQRRPAVGAAMALEVLERNDVHGTVRSQPGARASLLRAGTEHGQRAGARPTERHALASLGSRPCLQRVRSTFCGSRSRVLL